MQKPSDLAVSREVLNLASTIHIWEENTYWKEKKFSQYISILDEKSHIVIQDTSPLLIGSNPWLILYNQLALAKLGRRLRYSAK